MAPYKGERLSNLKKKSKTVSKKIAPVDSETKKITPNLAELKKRTPRAKSSSSSGVKELKKSAAKRVLVREKARDLRQLLSHAIIYVAVNIFLIFINFVYYKDYYWFYWVLIGWGIGLAFHWLDVMNYNPINEEWVEAEAKKIVNK